jgi:hypothetical protein
MVGEPRRNWPNYIGIVVRGKGCGKRIRRSAWNVSICSSHSLLYATSPRPCSSDLTSNLTLLLYVRRLFTRLSDVARSFIVVDASFAPGIFAPATVVCTQYLSICTRYLEYLGFSPYPVTLTGCYWLLSDLEPALFQTQITLFEPSALGETLHIYCLPESHTCDHWYDWKCIGRPSKSWGS